MVIIQPPEEQFAGLSYFHNPVVVFDGRDVLLGVTGPGERDVTMLRFEHAITFRTLPVSSEHLGDYKYRVKHFALNEITGADETREWELLDARFWAIPFNDLLIEIVFFGAVSIDPKGGMGQTLEQLIRAVK